jgi:CBS domain-containing protein
MTDANDEYSELQDQDRREIRGALFEDTLAALRPREPVCVTAGAMVKDVVAAMLAGRQAGVLVLDGTGRLAGIFTERDVLTRVVGRGVDVAQTTVGQVMTAKPEALRPDDRVAYALHCMSVAGYRTVPVVDADGRPIGVVTASDVIQWLANLFPETVMNLAPGDRLKHPEQIDAG